MAFRAFHRGPKAIEAAYKRKNAKRDVQLHGIRADHSKHSVTLLDLNNGLKAWWWNSVSSATWLIAQPSLARLTWRGSVYEALALLSDIISIGDLVLSLRRDAIMTELLSKCSLEISGRSSPLLARNAILEALELDWGPLPFPFNLSSTFKYPRDEPQEYGILFFVLIVKTNMFSMGWGVDKKITNNLSLRHIMREHGTSMTSNPRISGQEIIDKLELLKCKDEKDFTQKQTNLVDKWLVSWGFSQDSLESVRSP